MPERECSADDARGLNAKRYSVAARWSDAFVDDGRLPGVVVAVERDGSTFEHAAGVFKKNSIFRICSMTKALVAVAAATIIEDGLLPLGLGAAAARLFFFRFEVVTATDRCATCCGAGEASAGGAGAGAGSSESA